MSATWHLAVYGSRPTFIICSATVANPREHAQVSRRRADIARADVARADVAPDDVAFDDAAMADPAFPDVAGVGGAARGGGGDGGRQSLRRESVCVLEPAHCRAATCTCGPVTAPVHTCVSA